MDTDPETSRNNKARTGRALLGVSCPVGLIETAEWCGDRRTVVGREGPVCAELEFGGFFDVPHRVSRKKSAGYGVQWNRIGTCRGSSESFTHPLQMLGSVRKPLNLPESRRNPDVP